MAYCVSCLADCKNEEFYSLFSTYMNDGDEVRYADIYKSCFNIVFDDKDGDKVVCSKCLSKLKCANEFKQQTFNIQQILSNTKALKQDGVDNEGMVEYLDPTIWEEEPAVRAETPAEYKNEILFELERIADDSGQDPDFNIDDILPNNNEIVITKVETGNQEQYLSEAYKKKLTKRGRVKKNSFAAKPYKLSEGQTTCHICGKGFVYQKLLVEHMSLHFPNCVCFKCGKKFVNKEAMKRHEKSHWEGPFVCKICDKTFNSYNTFSAHKYYKHNEEPFKCRYCGQKFKTFMTRLKHLIVVHNIECKFACDFCDKKFYHSGQRSVHMKKVHNANSRVKCTTCPKTFKSRHEMTKHRVNEHNQSANQTFNCGVCSRSFKSMTALNYHMRSHGSGPRFLCHVCNTSFIYKCSLTNHVRNHKNNGINAKVVGDSAILDEQDLYVDDFATCHDWA